MLLYFFPDLKAAISATAALKWYSRDVTRSKEMFIKDSSRLSGVNDVAQGSHQLVVLLIEYLYRFLLQADDSILLFDL